MQAGGERKRLVRRTTQSPGLVRRTTPYVRNDGRMAYYVSGRGVRVVTSPGDPVAELYRRVSEWGEKLLNILERVEGGPTGPRELPDNLEDPIQTTKQVVLALGLMAKAGRVLVLAFWACMYLVWQRFKQLGGGLH
jgi:hypothetical protein